MIKKGTRLYSILNHTCPRCHGDSLFKSKAYQLSRFMQMPDACSKCGQRYFLEPSFYSGAMYVSHALQVALLTSVYVTIRVLFNPEGENVYIISTIAFAVLLLPINLRLSRSIYINFFVSYNRDHDRHH